MMKLISKSALMAIATGALVLSSCTDDKDYYDENYRNELYKSQWEKTFGAIDPNQDWCMATQKTVNITVDGTKTVQILTGNPYLNEGKLVGEFTVTNQLSAKIDLLKGLSVIYVAQRNEDGTKDVRTINVGEDGTFNVNFSSSAAKARTRAVTRSGARSCTEFTTVDRCTPYATGLYYWSDGNDTYSCLWDEAPKKYNNWGDKYYYVGDNAYGNDALVDLSVFDAIRQIVPENEKSSYYSTIIQDVDLIVKKDGPITLTLASATTSNNAAIGYYIYTDKKVDNTDMACPEGLTGEWLQNNGYTNQYPGYTVETRTGITDAQKLADKFVIIPNVKASNLNPTENHAPATEENGWNYNITESYNCKTINLLYKNPSTGEISETFPAGTKIAFFIVPNANCSGSSYIDAKRTVFSFADMNVDAHRTSVGDGYYQDFDEKTYSSSHAATFKVQDKIVIGFEDDKAYSSADFDYNDCIFLLDGNFDEDIIPDPIPEESPKTQSWILACEDLGGSYDFDFNDVVLKIKYTAGETIAYATLLAAGGTLPASVSFDNKLLYEEVHEAFGVDVKTMVNTGLATGEKDPGTVSFTVPSDFTLTRDASNFKINVVQESGETTTINVADYNNKGTTPQAILVTGDWEWPRELQPIYDKYPAFNDWVKNAKMYNWYDTPWGE